MREERERKKKRMRERENVNVDRKLKAGQCLRIMRFRNRAVRPEGERDRGREDRFYPQNMEKSFKYNAVCRYCVNYKLSNL